MIDDLSENEKISMVEHDPYSIMKFKSRSHRLWSKVFSFLNAAEYGQEKRFLSFVTGHMNELSSENLVEAAHSGFSLLDADPDIVSGIDPDQFKKLFKTPHYVELPAGVDIDPDVQDECLFEAVADTNNKSTIFSIKASSFFQCKRLSPIVKEIKKTNKFILQSSELKAIIKKLVVDGVYDKSLFDKLGIEINDSEIILEQI